jgi:hypothetical protein
LFFFEPLPKRLLHLLRNTIKSTIATVAPASNENVSILREKRISFSLEYICVVGE